MNPTVSQLLGSGLLISAIGLGLVFAALALLWGMTRLITKIFADKEVPVPEVSLVLDEAELAEAQAAVEAAVELTEERARVAAIVAGALLSNALPVVFQAPPGPAFEHGRISPSWVTSNRARALPSFQRPRIAETNPRNDG